jgi:hypothetical protein
LTFDELCANDAKYLLMKGYCYTCVNCGSTKPGGILQCFVHDKPIKEADSCEYWMDLGFMDNLEE